VLEVVGAVEVLELSLLLELFSLLAGVGVVEAVVVEAAPFPSPRESVR
jgi:hypothetical protein